VDKIVWSRILQKRHLGEGTVLYPLVEYRTRLMVGGTMMGVEFVDDIFKHASALLGVSDDGRDGGYVGDYAVFEVEDEFGVVREVQQPVAWARSRDATEVRRLVDSIEANLNPSRLSRPTTERGDVDGSLGHITRIPFGKGDE